MSDEKKPKQLPSSEISISIKIGVNEQDYDIKYPTIGQLIDIEKLKIKYSDGTSSQMIFGGENAIKAFMFTEAVAIFTILVPKLKEDLNLKSLFDLTSIQAKSMLKAYEKYHTWMQEWKEIENAEDE